MAFFQSPCFMALAAFSAGPAPRFFMLWNCCLRLSLPPICWRRCSSCLIRSFSLTAAFVRSASCFSASSRVPCSIFLKSPSASLRPLLLGLLALLFDFLAHRFGRLLDLLLSAGGRVRIEAARGLAVVDERDEHERDRGRHERPPCAAIQLHAEFLVDLDALHGAHARR